MGRCRKEVEVLYNYVVKKLKQIKINPKQLIAVQKTSFLLKARVSRVANSSM